MPPLFYTMKISPRLGLPATLPEMQTCTDRQEVALLQCTVIDDGRK